MPYQRGPVKSFGAAVSATSPEQQQADLLLRQLESQLRRQLGGTPTGANLAAATRHWAERFGALVPALAGEAAEVADALQGLDDAGGAARTAGIGQAMRLLARVRSLTAGEQPRQVVLPGADGPPPLLGVTAPLRAQQAPAVPLSAHGQGRARSASVSSTPTATSGPTTAPSVSRSPARSMSRPAQTGLGIPKAQGRSPSSNKKAAPARLPSTPGAGRRKAGPPPGGWMLASPVETMERFDQRYAAPLGKLRVQTLGEPLHSITTLGDLLHHFPRRYQDYSKLLPIAQLRPGEDVTIEVTVAQCAAVGPYRDRGRRVEATFADATGTIRGVWFGQSWRARQLKPGLHLYVSGRVERFGSRLQFTHPDYEEVTEKEAIHTGRLVPIYRLSGEMPASWLRGRMKWVVDELAHLTPEHFPEAFQQRWNLSPRHSAIQQIHFPESDRELQDARRRLAFDDFCLLHIGLLRQRQQWQSMPAIPLALPSGRLQEFLERLPFRLTAAQRHALDEILLDVAGERPMGRLLQGDVGSGKTVIAALAALAAVENGCQAAIVAPTEVLAEQHARTLAALFAEIMPMLKPVLITGSLSVRAQADAWKLVASGQAAVVVGTHALFSKRGEFSRLALVVVDEQHRFGVYQRDTLWRKGERPHLLAMTATPIPRTLALLQHGDLDLSVIDSLPMGRLPIKTCYVAPQRREGVYAFLRRQVMEGRQAFVICPLVDESDVVAAKSVTAEFRRLKDEVFPDLALGLLHGRMKPAEKDATMRAFRDGKTQVLVATTVIEVGVDVPNATVMLIEGAERFGLAQLHQLRGRVGRGSHQSHCVLMASETIDEAGEQRLRHVESTTDGFALAEADLEERRTGTFFGSEQSGDDGLLRWYNAERSVKIGRDAGEQRTKKERREAVERLLDEARRAAAGLLAEDPTLSQPEHAMLAALVKGLLPQQAAAGASSRKGQETASLTFV